MRIEDLLDGKMEVEVSHINVSNRIGPTGAKERQNTVYLRTRHDYIGGYLDINFDVSTADMDNYPPDTRFRVRLERI
jgi:hypothetical protein